MTPKPCVKPKEEEVKAEMKWWPKWKKIPEGWEEVVANEKSQHSVHAVLIRKKK